MGDANRAMNFLVSQLTVLHAQAGCTCACLRFCSSDLPEHVPTYLQQNAVDRTMKSLGQTFQSIKES